MISIYAVNPVGVPLFAFFPCDVPQILSDKIEQTSRTVFDSGLSIEPNFAFRRRADAFSGGESITQSSLDPRLCLEIISLNNTRWASSIS
jgi:hypothetical protein